MALGILKKYHFLPRCRLIQEILTSLLLGFSVYYNKGHYGDSGGERCIPVWGLRILHKGHYWVSVAFLLGVSIYYKMGH